MQRQDCVFFKLITVVMLNTQLSYFGLRSKKKKKTRYICYLIYTCILLGHAVFYSLTGLEEKS